MDCFCLPLPVQNGLNGMSFEETLLHIDQVDFKDLREDFRTGIVELFDTIKRNIFPKTVLSVQLSASVFSKYIETVVQKLNDNERISLFDSLALSIEYASDLYNASKYYSLLKIIIF